MGSSHLGWWLVRAAALASFPLIIPRAMNLTSEVTHAS